MIHHNQRDSLRVWPCHSSIHRLLSATRDWGLSTLCETTI
jgi:hypothetical protein